MRHVGSDWTSPEPTPEAQGPCQVFILTCDRPAALNRVLSGLRKFPLPEVVEGVLIIDDSRYAENIQENRSIIGVQSDNAKVPVVHVDPGVKEDLIQHLKTALPNYRESIEWLLDRSVWGTAPTYGIARNLALLLSVGKRALMLDDDIIPQAVAPPLSAAACVLAPLTSEKPFLPVARVTRAACFAAARVTFDDDVGIRWESLWQIF